LHFNTKLQTRIFLEPEDPRKAHVLGYRSTIPVVIVIWDPVSELARRRMSPRVVIQNKRRKGIPVGIDFGRVQRHARNPLSPGGFTGRMDSGSCE
jgi:hypothetical protein